MSTMYRDLVAAGDDPGAPQRVRLERMGDRARVTLAEPERLNVLTAPLVRQLRRELEDLVREAEVRTVVLTGADPAFSAGGDLRMMEAAGAGLAWALTCDIAIASERAVIVPAFGKLGLLPEVGTSWALTRRLGYQGAYAYYLRGEHIDAHAALRMGLVQEVVPHDALLR